MIYAAVCVVAGSRSGGARRDAPRRYSAADVERRRRLLRRGLPAAAVVAVVALALGLIAGTGPGRAEKRTVQRYAALWARGDYDGMYGLLSDDARARTSPAAFKAAYDGASETATTRTVSVERVGGKDDGVFPVRVRIRTAVFGTVDGVVDVPLSGSGGDARVDWRPQLVFPDLQPGERLTRETRMPERATLLARDGTVLAKGDDRGSDAPDVSAQIVGQLGQIPADELGSMRALGYPDDARVGTSGLERIFQVQLAGTPGGRLLGGTRVLARSQPHAGAPVRTTIDPEIERKATEQMGGRYGGIAAMDPKTGQVLALAGVAFSGLQPPGSTFKIITLTGALEAGIAKPTDSYPVQSEATLSGVAIQNANGEYCGGTLVQSFAESCNSVFAPLGARLGGDRLKALAERYGFNAPVGIPGAAESTFPGGENLVDDLAVGSAAIGQGMVQATALQMMLVAATIADGGRRPIPTLQMGVRPRFVRVTSPAVARQVAQMMRAVVMSGTGTAAGIEGADVAGKTGTAELRSTVPPDDGSVDAGDDATQDDVPDTDAWFVAFAPAPKPRVAVGVMFSEAGAGGDVAAPAAREVLVTSLQRTQHGG